MSALQARIQALHHQAGTRAALACIDIPTQSLPSGPLPAALTHWLDQRKRLQARSAGLTLQVPGVESQASLPGNEIAPGLRLYVHSYPAALPASVCQIRFRPVGQFKTEKLLYFDTETTGLSGGTGTRAFMIGCADWHEGQLRIRQLLCTRLAAEAQMLRQFCNWLSPETVLVSFNGRSFDAPLLKTRLRLAQMAEPLSALSHIDLIYPTRRLYRGRWSDCRLSTLEANVLKVVREDDLPGAEAPRAWLSYLRFGCTAKLSRVIQHNTQDLRSLHGLLWHLVQIDQQAFELRS